MFKNLFSFLAGAGMLGDTLLPILAGDHIGWLRWRIPMIVCGVVALVALAIQLRLQYREEVEGRKAQQERDKRFEELATEIISIKDAPKSVRGQDEQTDLLQSSGSDLRKKIIEMAHRLFEFLKERGPEPPDPINHLRSTDKQWKEVWERYDPYVERIHHDYLRLYRGPMVDLYHELAAKGIRIPGVTESDIDPPQAVRAATVRKVAEQLLIMATKMD